MKIELIKTDQINQPCYFVRIEGKIISGSITSDEKTAYAIYNDLVEKKGIVGISQVLEETIIE